MDIKDVLITIAVMLVLSGSNINRLKTVTQDVRGSIRRIWAETETLGPNEYVSLWEALANELDPDLKAAEYTTLEVVFKKELSQYVESAAGAGLFDFHGGSVVPSDMDLVAAAACKYGTPIIIRRTEGIYTVPTNAEDAPPGLRITIFEHGFRVTK